MSKAYLIGGRLGDAINGLMIPAYYYQVTGEKADIYMANIGDNFTAGIERTFEELKPIMAAQDYMNSFQIWDMKAPIDTHLWQFRLSSILEKHCWTEIYFSMFAPDREVPYNFTWIKWIRQRLDGCLLVSRGYCLDASTAHYIKIIGEWPKDEVYYLGNEKQWLASGLSEHTQLMDAPDLSCMFAAINRCEMLLCDQSMPASIATAMGKQVIIECNRLKSMVEGEGYYRDSLQWFSRGYVPLEKTRQ